MFIWYIIYYMYIYLCFLDFVCLLLSLEFCSLEEVHSNSGHYRANYCYCASKIRYVRYPRRSDIEVDSLEIQLTNTISFFSLRASCSESSSSTPSFYGWVIGHYTRVSRFSSFSQIGYSIHIISFLIP